MDERHRQLLTRILAAAIVVSAGGVLYLSVTPSQSAAPYTEFYVLGTDGNASDYPTSLAVGDEGTLVVGVGNHEHQRMAYTLVILVGDRTAVREAITVQHETTWEDERTFVAETAGQKRIQLLLYRGTDDSATAEPYRTLTLHLTVRDR